MKAVWIIRVALAIGWIVFFLWLIVTILKSL